MLDSTPNHDNIPYGYCHCGCGEKTPLAPYARRGYVKGEPLKFIHGHNGRVDGSNRRAPSIELPNPSGLCMCGCGQVTPIASSTSLQAHRIKGHHTRYCTGHHAAIAESSEKFWKRVDKRGPDDCWEWQSYINDSGYGVTRGRRNKAFRAHVLAYEFTYGPIDGGLFVCHKCDNRKCCNPAHLFLGTAADNNRDMWEKGRGVRESGRRGELHGMSKLTDDDVREIRRLAHDGVSYAELGRRYGISGVQISRIVKRQCWKHLP